MESDLKSLIQYLETALQITLLKYEAALAAAQNSRTSPYTLTQTELIKLVSETHLKTRHTIDSNINHARTTAIIVNNTLSFIIKIPLLDDDKFFNFYSVKAVPTFYKNTTLYPDIETNNIAISADGNKYVVLDQTELDICMDTPSICNSHSPIQPFRIKHFVLSLPTPQIHQLANSKPFTHNLLFFSISTASITKCFIQH
jgi:hypothetical protein